MLQVNLHLTARKAIVAVFDYRADRHDGLPSLA
jgi:hypothetical protein